MWAILSHAFELTQRRIFWVQETVDGQHKRGEGECQEITDHSEPPLPADKLMVTQGWESAKIGEGGRASLTGNWNICRSKSTKFCWQVPMVQSNTKRRRVTFTGFHSFTQHSVSSYQVPTVGTQRGTKHT